MLSFYNETPRKIIRRVTSMVVYTSWGSPPISSTQEGVCEDRERTWLRWGKPSQMEKWVEIRVVAAGGLAKARVDGGWLGHAWWATVAHINVFGVCFAFLPQAP